MGGENLVLARIGTSCNVVLLLLLQLSLLYSIGTHILVSILLHRLFRHPFFSRKANVLALQALATVCKPSGPLQTQQSMLQQLEIKLPLALRRAIREQFRSFCRVLDLEEQLNANVSAALTTTTPKRPSCVSCT